MSQGEVSLRPRQRLPEHLDGADKISHNPSHRIEFKHPAYTNNCNTFLVLAAFDHSDGGLHYNTALIACGIIAGNRWDGYFTAARDGPRVSLGEDDLIPHGQLYFYLPGYTYGMSWYPVNNLLLTIANRMYRRIIPDHPQLQSLDVSTR